MPNLDAFSAQLVDFVRRMSDEALLALVRAQLATAGVGAAAGRTALPGGAPAVTAAAAPAAKAPAVKRGPKPKAKRPAPAAPAAPAPRPAPPPPPAAKPGPAKAKAPPAKPPSAPKAPAKAALPKKAPAKKAPAPKAPAKKALAKPAPAKKAPAPKALKASPRGNAASRVELLSIVERIVKAGAGVSASEVAKGAGVPQSRASSALKELKLAKRVFQGGDRRFARYAGDARTALQASENARRNASGPILKKK